MHLLLIGSGTPSSFEIRGHQLGALLGARVTATPTPQDFAWSDVIVFVKRGKTRYQDEALRSGRPILWDALDFWSQPLENGDGESLARQRFINQIRSLQPARVIGATQHQAQAAGRWGVYLPHHAWPGLTPGDVRPDIKTIGYQGNPAYLGAWAGWLTSACQRHGWTLALNPADLREADVLVAFRDGPWDGWQCRHWKSGVKLVNAIAAGRPILTQWSAALEEILPPGSLVEVAADLDRALEDWRDPMRRRAAAEQCARLAPAYTLQAVARQYDAILEGVRHVSSVN